MKMIVEGFRFPTIGFIENQTKIVPRFEFRQYFPAVVRATVINHDQIRIRTVYGKDTIHGLADGIGIIVTWNDE
jgi:hypothetical protein